MNADLIAARARAAGLDRALADFPDDVIAAAEIAGAAEPAPPDSPATEPWPPMQPGTAL